MSDHIRGNIGWIEVVCGPMFSGKSEELIRRLRRAQIGKQRVQIFKPQIDTRFSDDYIVSHSDQRIASQVVNNSQEVLQLIDGRTEVVGIDEVQFFDPGIVEVINKRADMC
jgi:thymidine kinase